ncbi:flagellar hook assembly protein FlgD [Roseibium alexandrii]|jgi:flagellar basal-body rod modification protein FlgD|uniref:Basal-body rod modification protein FlgD n=1 Tax=Roseibium alexandrii (strain DSM 17067 / NCIMB 14079 / DFL-11) TaxID=244592 RepID=A0A5E8H6M4_ROSAD|nr:flagellar hook capping FlgD N-terminal domain-containing protein [Roseibium alexandrii]EEE47696.2 Flagellar hook capping protein [Roseibium alexandrii DFL-11]
MTFFSPSASSTNSTSSTSGAAQSSSQSSTQASEAGLSANYELFLSMLTTQIQNQDPLDPLDSAEYTNQLVQYSNVEQSIQTNKNLEEMISLLSSNQSSAYVNYIGTEVTAAGGTAMFDNGQASWKYDVLEDATGTVEILNDAGQTVYSGEIQLKAGGGTYTWDGTTDLGGTASKGAYTIQLDVKDSAGTAEPASIEVSGVVDEVNFGGAVPFLRIGEISVPVSAVKSVRSI